MKKVLFVHAYAVRIRENNETLDPFMQQTINHVAQCHIGYDEIILLGGWHEKALGEHRLLGDVMKEHLIQEDVPAEKIKNLHDFDFGYKYMPPRSTEEEIILARSIINLMEETVQIIPCFVDYFTPKALWYYDKIGVELTGLELVRIELSVEKNLQITRLIMAKFEELRYDPALMSLSTLNHLDSRTLGIGYTRPNPETFFHK